MGISPYTTSVFQIVCGLLLSKRGCPYKSDVPRYLPHIKSVLILSNEDLTY